MKFIIRYILVIGVLFMLLGVFGIYDWFNRGLDFTIGVSGVTRMLTGSVFVVGAMGLLRLDDFDE